MSNSKELKQQLDAARTYVEKIGRVESHFRPNTYGRLHTMKVDTQITHQESPSAQNYWQDKKFDCALAAVVSRRFEELAAEALALMELAYKEQFIAEKSALLAQLAEIEALEKEAA